MRYLLVDRILEWERGMRIRGIKNVTMTEDFLEFHFPGNPVMPGVLLIESLVQLAGWLEAAGSGFTDGLLLTAVRRCNFYGFVLPGDQAELQVEFVPPGEDGSVRVCKGIGTVEGKKKIVVEFEAQTVPLATLEEPAEQERFFRILSRESAF